MRLSERLERLRGSGGADACETQPEQLEAIGREADDLLAAAASAIDRTLSKNSESFLSECIQEGGQ